MSAPPAGSPPTSPASFSGEPLLASDGGIAGGPVTLRVRGRFVFQRAVEAAPATVGGARMRVEIWDEDPISDELMWETETDEQGFFDTTFEWDDCDITGCDDPDLYVVVRAINDDHDVQRDTILQTTWAWSTSDSVLEDVTSTDIQLGSIQPDDLAEHGAVHVHTVLALSRDALAPIGFAIFFPQLEVDWAPDAERTELDGTRLSLSAADGWSEVVIAREHLLFVFEGKTNEPLASLCNGICDTDGCTYCLWCMEPPLAAWRVGVATWWGDALSRSMPSITGAPPLTTLPEIDATFPCPDGLPSNIHWVPGYVAALLRDLEDSVEILDVDGDGIDDVPPETACERDSLARGLSETVERVFVGEHDDIDEFVDYLWATDLPEAALWRTLRRIGGDTWTEPDTGAPFITSAFSSTHPNGVGPTPFATLAIFGSDAASGISGASVVWAPSLTAAVDEVMDVASLPSGSVLLESPAIPYAGVLYLHIRLVDCVGNWSTPVIFGPLSVTDCDEDGVPDFCACGGCASLPGYCPPEVCGSVADCNGNLVPDACEVESGAADDCNGDGIPDACQGETNRFFPPFGSSEASWNTASNWSLGDVPNASQIACLDLNATDYVTRLQWPPASVLGFGCDHILDVQTTLQSATESHAHRIDLNGGTLTGAGDLVVSELRWTTGTITRVPNTSPMLTATSLTTIGNFQKSLARDTLVTQTLAHTAGQLGLSDGASLEIGPFATASITTGASVTWLTGAAPSLVNHGLFRKLAAGTAPIFWIPFTNQGTLDVAEGRLELPGGASTGDVTIGEGATLALQSGTFTFEPNSTLDGDRLEIGGGTAIFGGDVTLEQFVLGSASSTATLLPSASFDATGTTFAGGTLDGGGDLTTDSLAWAGGTMSGAGTTTTDSLTIGGLGQKNLRRSLVVTGEGTSVASNVGLSQDGNLIVARGASLALENDAGFTWISGSQPGTLINHGTVTREGPGLSNLSLVSLSNHGSIDVAGGTLRLNGTGTHTGSLAGSAAVDITGGSQSFAASSAISVAQLSLTGGSLATTGGFVPGALTLSNGTLTLDGAGFSITNSMSFGGGTLAGAAPLTVNGPLTWTGGAMTGTGSLVVNGLATLAGSGSKSIRRTLVANGSMVVTSANVGVDGGGQLVVPSGAELSLVGGASLTWVAGSSPGTITVDGTLRKAGDAGSATINFAPTTIAGSIAIDGGTLQLVSPCTVSGPVTGAVGTELSLTGSAPQSFTSSANATLGSLRLAATAASFAAPVSAQSVTVTNGTATVNGPLTASVWLHQNGTVGGSGSITVNGPLTFTSGTLAGGSATMDVLGTTLLSSATTKSVARTLRTHGATEWSAGAVALGGPGGNAQWRIVPSGSLVITGSSPTMTWTTGLPGTFVNEGFLQTLASTGTTSVVGIGMTNSGTFELHGTLWRFSSAPTFLQSAGATIVHAGRELEHSGSVVINGGTLTGGGLVDADVLIGAATVAPGDGIGTLSIEGPIAFSAASSLAITVASSEQDRLAVSGPLTCAGGISVSLANGFVPAIGDSFVIATCTTRNGTFASASAATPLPSDRRWAMQHSPTNVTLVVVPALPCAGDLNLDATVGPVDLALLLGAWGTDGVLSGADLNEDGIVSAPDLAILLGAWGPCPAGAIGDEDTEGGVARATPERERDTLADRSTSKRTRREQAAQPSRIDSLLASAHASGAEPVVIDGAFELPADEAMDRTISVLLEETDNDGCFSDATILAITGNATLEGVLRVTLADDLDVVPGLCIRILVANTIAGEPTLEVFHRGERVEVEVHIDQSALLFTVIDLPSPRN